MRAIDGTYLPATGGTYLSATGGTPRASRANKNAELSKLIYFVFPEKSNQPVILQYKIRLWNHLSELSADRFGFLAVPDLKTCITAFFKMSSGLDFDRVDMKVEAFIEENMKRLEYFKKDQGVNIKSLS